MCTVLAEYVTQVMVGGRDKGEVSRSGMQVPLEYRRRQQSEDR